LPSPANFPGSGEDRSPQVVGRRDRRAARSARAGHLRARVALREEHLRIFGGATVVVGGGGAERLSRTAA
jgi:hypothetical protein